MAINESIDKKGLRFNEYCVYDERLAKMLIDSKKYMWFIDEREHWKTKKVGECYVFEFVQGIKEDYQKAKNIVFGSGKRV